jgi:ABC-type multidrug transport system ATPase subunit
LISISVNKLGKKFNREWVFRNVELDVPQGSKLAVLGGNGSGKSTLIQVISGFVSASEGSVIFHKNQEPISAEETKNFISYASPYLQLIEDFTLTELIDHISIFKPFIGKLAPKEIAERLQLDHVSQKYIRQYSSGMKQRAKLGLALLSDTPVVFLDEPHSNLDRSAIDWYQTMITDYAGERTVFVCSNSISDEYYFCTTSVQLSGYK